MALGAPGFIPCWNNGSSCKVEHNCDIISTNKDDIRAYDATCFEKCPYGIIANVLTEREVEYCLKIGREMDTDNGGLVLKFPKQAANGPGGI